MMIFLLFHIINNRCNRCVHYIQDSNYHFLNKCSKFEKIDLFTGNIKYNYADLCREDNNKCGIYGKWFEEKKIKEIIKKN